MLEYEFHLDIFYIARSLGYSKCVAQEFTISDL